MNLLRIGFNPQIYKKLRVHLTLEINFPEFVYITEVNSEEVCLCNKVKFGLLFHI